MGKVYEFSFGYSVTKVYAEYCFKMYYGSYVVRGKENIDGDKHVILAPNHQNALMDALAILNSNSLRTVFLARADIFKNRQIAAILKFLRMMPIYRIRDGRDHLDKNEEVFTESTNVLHSGSTLCLMPEGTQSFKRILMPLVKGTFRIAFRTQEELGEDPLYIVPVGIDYESYVDEGAGLIVRFGEPIDIKSYMARYNEQSAVVMNQLRDRLYGEIDGLIQNIRTDEHYDMIYDLSWMFCREMAKGKVEQLEARRSITKGVDRAFAAEDGHEAEVLVKQYDSYVGLLKRHKVKDRAVAEKRSFGYNFLHLLLLIVLSPVGLVVWATNAIQKYLPRIVTRKFKTQDFVSSVHFVAYLVLNLLISLTLLVVSFFTVIPWWAAVAFFLVAPALMRVVSVYSKGWKVCCANWKFMLKGRVARDEMKSRRAELASTVREMVEK